MNKFMKFTTIITASMMMLSLSAFTTPKKTTTPKNMTLSFGAVSSIDVVPIIVAEEKGFFKKENLTVKFNPFKSPKDRDAAFQSGALDGIICDEIAICLYNNASFKVKITGKTNGDFQLISSPNSGIKSISDIKGKSVAISEKTSIEYTLDKVLVNSSLATTDVKKVMIPPIPTRLEMLRNDKVDAALLPEPYASLALKAGGTLLGSASKLATYPSVTAFTDKAILKKSLEIKAFYKAYNSAVDYINNNPVKNYEDVLIKTVGYPEEMRGNITLPAFKKNLLPSNKELADVIAWTQQNKLIQKSFTPAELMNTIGIK